MRDQDKKKEQLIDELVDLRQRIAKLEASEVQSTPAEEALPESEVRYQAIFKASLDGICIVDDKGRILANNSAFSQMFGYNRPSETQGRCLFDFMPSERGKFIQARSNGKGPSRSLPPTFSGKVTRRGGGEIDIEANSRCYQISGRWNTICILRNVTEQKRMAEERKITVELLRVINSAKITPELLKFLTAFLQNCTGCEAVGVRLRDGSDFPYFETRGFPQEFVLAENRLCALDQKGELIHDSEGNPVLECMCGNVICGRFDPSKPFFTKNGSFWTNSLKKLLASTTEADLQAPTRNKCNSEGYESVALIPIRFGARTFGLLQFNDKRKGRFTPELISFLENVGDNIAIALAQKRTEDKLKTSLREKEMLLREIHHRVKNNLQIISSLLDMSSMRTHSKAAISFSRDARAKIQTMALIHSQLYRSDRFDEVDIGIHVKDLFEYLSQVYGERKKSIANVIKCSDVYLSLAKAIPCALVLNEVISNAFEHAFKEKQQGKIEIFIKKSAHGTIFIRVKDDGIGIPDEIDIYTIDSLGLKLVRNIVQEQLKGKMQIKRINGTEIIIEFKILEEERKYA